jgi:hypothetical protein
MRFKFLIAALTFLITQTALAAAPVIPTTCPTVDAFKHTGVSYALSDEDGTWDGIEWKNNFGTENEWTFGVVGINADSASEALTKANATIPGLVFKQGPVKMGTGQEPIWLCMYSSSVKEFGGVAVTPAMTPETSKLTRLMHSK